MADDNDAKELSDEELSNVAGGCDKKPEPANYQGHPLVATFWKPVCPNLGKIKEGFKGDYPPSCAICCNCEILPSELIGKYGDLNAYCKAQRV